MAAYVDCVSTIFTSTISVSTGFCQCQTNRRAQKLNLLLIFNNIYIITITENRVHFLDKFQIGTSESEGIAICLTVARTSFIILAYNLKKCFADILMLIFVKSQ